MMWPQSWGGRRTGRDNGSRLWAALSNANREALLLTYVDEYSPATLARAVGVSKDSLAARAAEARRLLHERGCDDRMIDTVARQIIERPLPLVRSRTRHTWMAAACTGLTAWALLALAIGIANQRPPAAAGDPLARNNKAEQLANWRADSDPVRGVGAHAGKDEQRANWGTAVGRG